MGHAPQEKEDLSTGTKSLTQFAPKHISVLTTNEKPVRAYLRRSEGAPLPLHVAISSAAVRYYRCPAGIDRLQHGRLT